MSLNCPGCGLNLSLSLVVGAPQLVPQVTPTEQVGPQLGDVRTSPKKARFSYPDPNFHLFWNAYPRRVGKASAYSKWLVAVREVEPQTIIQAASSYASKTKHLEAQYLPYPEKWLNDGRWEDEDSGLADNTPKATDLDALRAEMDARVAEWGNDGSS